MLDWFTSGFVSWGLGVVPTWVWVVAAGLAIGWAWRVFGWQGIVGALAAVVTLGAYRQGWRDRGGEDVVGRSHPDRPEDKVVGVERATPARRRTLVDILRGDP